MVPRTRCSSYVAALAAALLFPLAAHAQGRGEIRGEVTDAATAQPRSSARVSVPGTRFVTFTDRSGAYVLVGIPAGEYPLSAALLGYGVEARTVTVIAGETVTVNFQMTVAAISLGEIVVTGYEVVRGRTERTAAATRLNAVDIENLPIQTIEHAIQGRVPGVRVGATSGLPGSGLRIRIRGIGSIDAGNSPLYIVDGVQLASDREQGSYASTSPLAALNPKDIESIEILKDAAATSIYGAQAANGVVLITTKRGLPGRTQWVLSSEYGIVDDMKRWDVVRGPDWVRLQMEARANRWEDLGLLRADGELDAIARYGDPNEVGHFDWQDAILRQGRMSKINASARGGTEDTRFFLSGSYSKQDGQLVLTDFQRFSMRANIDHQPSERFSMIATIGLASTNQEGEFTGNCQNCAFWAAPHMRPTLPIFNDDGSYNQAIAPVPYNIAYQIFEQDQRAWTRQAIGSLTGNYSITPRLNFRSLWGLEYRMRRETQYRPPEQQVIGDRGLERFREVVNWTTNQLLNYSTSFGGVHNVTALVGGEYRDESSERFTAIGTGYPSGLFRTLDLAAAPQGVSGATGGFKLASVFGRVQYDYDDRYLLSGSLRYDGSSRFGSDFRWGLFYSGSAGWNMARERFMEGFGFLDDFTLRFSYGITGNSAIGDFASLTLFGTGGSYASLAGLRPSQLGNNELTWETAKTTNIGLNWSVGAGRLYGSVDLFRKNNVSLLLDAFLPSDAGFGSVTRNVGKVRNEGIEFELGGVPIGGGGGFTWQTRFNIAFLRNEIVELVGGLENIGNTIRVGQPIQIYWGYKWAGVNPADGRPMWYDKDGNLTYRVTSDDRDVTGSRTPNLEGGWSNSISVGGLQLDVFMQYVLGLDVQDTQVDNLTNVASTRGLGTFIMGNYWTKPGDVKEIPRLYTSTSQPGTSSWQTGSDRFIYDGGYVRVKSVSLSYQLPAHIAQSLFKLRGARIYAQGNNLFTMTKFPGLDPEVMGTANATYPNSRQILFGMEILP